MELPHDMTTLSEVMNSQRKKGFEEDFEFDDTKIYAKSSGKKYEPDELTVVQVFRFEGISDPAYMEVLYAIIANDGTKGLFVDAFGTYGTQGTKDPLKLAGFLKKMKMLENHSKE
ncbi:MAG: hypothetical protein R6W90_18770 [Ignavibacteriaceae bacterium]